MHQAISNRKRTGHIARSLAVVALSIFAYTLAGAQSLHFLPQMQGARLLLNHPYPILKDRSPVIISMLKVYVGRIRLYRAGALVWADAQPYYLLDAGDTATWRITLQPPPGAAFDEVRYTIGIDSGTNAAGAQGGALDATLGMYWAWHSGYINVKLEGTSPALTTRGHRFEYHLGGFGEGKDCAVEMRAAARPGEDVSVAVQLEKFFENTDLPEPSIMTPGAAAQRLSSRFAQCFQTTTGLAK